MRPLLPALLAAGLALTACSGSSSSSQSATTTTDPPSPSVTTSPARKYTDPREMRTKVEAAGIALRQCSEPAYTVSNTLSMSCFTVAAPSEQVGFGTFEQPQSGEMVKQAVPVYGRAVHVDNGWYVDANTTATVEKLRAILAA